MREGHYLVKVLADAASIDFATCDRETARRVVFWAGQCLDAQSVWPRPQKVEISLSQVIAAIGDLREMIRNLDPAALQIARVAHHQNVSAKQGAGPADHLSVEGKLEGDALWECLVARYPAEEDLIDVATLRNLDALEHALNRPLAIASGLAKRGRGRPPEIASRAVALTAACALADLTGKQPTYRRATNGRDGTRYARLMESMFAFLFPGKNLDFERACKWALDAIAKR